MIKEIYIFKEKLSNLIELETMKVWLSRKEGKRLNYIFKLGNEQFDFAEIIAENKEFILLGENIGEEIKDEIRKIFEKYLV